MFSNVFISVRAFISSPQCYVHPIKVLSPGASLQNLALADQRSFTHLLALIGLLVLLTGYALRSAELTLTPEAAIRMTWPSTPGHAYQLEASTNLTLWWKIGDPVVACTSQSESYSTADKRLQFFRAVSLGAAPDTGLKGLTDAYSESAGISFEEGAVKIEGLRVKSDSLSLNDYLTASFKWDDCKQLFTVGQVNVITNLGFYATSAEHIYFYRDTSANLRITNGLTVLNAGTTYSVTSTGQVMKCFMEAGQVLTSVLEPASGPYRYITRDPDGRIVRDDDFANSSSWWYSRATPAKKPGIYSLQLLPTAGPSVTLRMRVVNGNELKTIQMTNDSTFSAVVKDYFDSYAKGAVALKAGQTISCSFGAASDVLFCSSRGTILGNLAGGGGLALVFRAPFDDTFFLIIRHGPVSFPGQTFTFTSKVKII